jgi:hypothetical protein
MSFYIAVMSIVSATATAQDQGLNPRLRAQRQAAGQENPNGAQMSPAPLRQERARPDVAPPVRRGLPIDPFSLPPRLTDAPPIDISGTWTGVFTNNELVYVADLTLTNTDASQRKLSGELHFKSLPSAAPGPMVHQPIKEGSWKVQGLVDPGAATLLLAQRGWATPSTAPGIQPMSFSLVYSPSLKQLAGQEDKQGGNPPQLPYCLFARAENADSLKKLAQHAAAVPSVLEAGPGNPPSDAALAQWSAKYDQEYPGSSQDPIDKSVIQSLPLLRDSEFKPVFGETYDTIDFAQLALAVQRVGGAVRAGMRGAPTPRLGSPPQQITIPQPPQDQPPLGLTPQQQRAWRIQQQQEYSRQIQQMMQQQRAVQNANRPDPAFAQSHMAVQYWLRPSSSRMISVAAVRVIDTWESEMLSHFEKDPPAGTAFDDLGATQQAARLRLVYAWPSDKKNLDATVEQVRTTTASTVLAANLARALAMPADVASARQLAFWADDNAQLLNYVSPAVREAATRQVHDKLDAVLTPLMAAPRAELASLGTGSNAVRAQVLWYDKFMQQWNFAIARPPVKDLLNDLVQRRDKDLTVAKPDFLRSISESKSMPALDALVKANLSLPGDPRLAAYPAIMQAITAQRAEVDKAALLALYSKREQDMMDRPGHIDLKKWDGKGPSAEEVRLAMLRAYTGKGRMIDAHTVRCETYNPMMIMMPFEFNITMKDEKLTRCDKVPNSPDFDCHFEILMVTQIPPNSTVGSIDPNIMQGFQMAAALENKDLEDAAHEDHHQVLRLTEGGWQVPDLRGGMEILNGMGNAARSMMRQ